MEVAGIMLDSSRAWVCPVRAMARGVRIGAAMEDETFEASKGGDMVAQSTVERPQAMNWRSSDSVKTLGKELYAQVKEDKVTTLAAAFAYYTVFAIPALIILSVTIAALL